MYIGKYKIDFCTISCSPKSHSIRSISMNTLDIDSIFYESSAIRPQREWVKIVDKSIPETSIIEIDFWHFCEFFSRISEKWFHEIDMIRSLEDREILFDFFCSEIESIGELIFTDEIPYLIGEEFHAYEIRIIIEYPPFKSIFFCIFLYEGFEEVFFLFYIFCESYARVSPIENIGIEIIRE